MTKNKIVLICVPMPNKCLTQYHLKQIFNSKQWSLKQSIQRIIKNVAGFIVEIHIEKHCSKQKKRTICCFVIYVNYPFFYTKTFISFFFLFPPCLLPSFQARVKLGIHYIFFSLKFFQLDLKEISFTSYLCLRWQQ